MVLCYTNLIYTIQTLSAPNSTISESTSDRSKINSSINVNSKLLTSDSASVGISGATFQPKYSSRSTKHSESRKRSQSLSTVPSANAQTTAIAGNDIVMPKQESTGCAIM